jgi:hypothetical protein
VGKLIENRMGIAIKTAATLTKQAVIYDAFSLLGINKNRS